MYIIYDNFLSLDIKNSINYSFKKNPKVTKGRREIGKIIFIKIDERSWCCLHILRHILVTLRV